MPLPLRWKLRALEDWRPIWAPTIAELLGKKNLSRGIRLQVEEENVTVEVAILVKYGYTIPDVGHAVQEAVAGSIEATSGLTVAAVNVSVGGVVFEKEPKKAQ